MTALHTDSFGTGPPALFIHGSFGWGLDTFPEQQQLADTHRVILLDRRGFGGSSGLEPTGWPADAPDVAALLDELGGAHLVGQSYGAVVALLAAGMRPDLVHSLTVIEPPAYGLARGNPDADATAAQLRPVFTDAATLSASQFVSRWAAATGMSAERATAWTDGCSEQDWAAVEASRHERWPGDAPIDTAVLRDAPFPRLVVRGAWPMDLSGRDGAGRDFAAVCNVLGERIGARVAVFQRSTHNPQVQEPERFNELLREHWASATTRS